MRRLLFLKNKRQYILYFFNWINRNSFYKNLFLDFFMKKLINYLMIDGKKEKAHKKFNDVCKYIKCCTKLCPVFVIRKTILNSFFLFDYRLIKKKK